MVYKGWFYFVPVYLYDTETIQAFTVKPRNVLLLPLLRFVMWIHRVNVKNKGNNASYPIKVTG